MGDNLQDFIALTKQYAQDIETEYDAFQEKQDAAAIEAAQEIKVAGQEHLDNMMNLTRTYLDNIAELPEGEAPDQDLPATGPAREPLPKPEPQ